MIELSLGLLDVSPVPGPSGTPGQSPSNHNQEFANLVGLAIDDVADGGAAGSGEDAGHGQPGSKPAAPWPGALGAWLTTGAGGPVAQSNGTSSAPPAKAPAKTEAGSAQKLSPGHDDEGKVVELLTSMTPAPPPVLQMPPIALKTDAAAPKASDASTDITAAHVTDGAHEIDNPATKPAAFATKQETQSTIAPPPRLAGPVTTQPANPQEVPQVQPGIETTSSYADRGVSRPEAARQGPAVVVNNPSAQATVTEQAAAVGDQKAMAIAQKVEAIPTPAQQSAAALHHAPRSPEPRRAENPALVEQASSSTPQDSSAPPTPHVRALAESSSSGSGHDATDQRPSDRRSSLPQTLTGIAPRLNPGDTALTATIGTGSTADVINAALSEDNGRAVLDQLVQAFRMQFRNGVGEAVVKLKPEHLGEVTISLRLDRGQVSANVQAELPAVRQWLESQETAVRQALAQHGLNLDKFVISRDPQSRQDKRQEQPTPGRRRPPTGNTEQTPRFEITV